MFVGSLHCIRRTTTFLKIAFRLRRRKQPANFSATSIIGCVHARYHKKTKLPPAPACLPCPDVFKAHSESAATAGGKHPLAARRPATRGAREHHRRYSGKLKVYFESVCKWASLEVSGETTSSTIMCSCHIKAAHSSPSEVRLPSTTGSPARKLTNLLQCSSSALLCQGVTPPTWYASSLPSRFPPKGALSRVQRPCCQLHLEGAARRGKFKRPCQQNKCCFSFALS